MHLSYADSTGYRLVRDGQPFYVQGAAGTARMDVLAAYGGNTVRVYDPDSLEVVLDRAESLGLAVIADIPIPAYYKNFWSEGHDLLAERDSVIALVDRFRGHPALLFWMLGNEVFMQGYDRAYLSQYNDLAELVRARDPDHPISTAVIPHQLLKLQLAWTRPAVDFLSLNTFGNLGTLDRLTSYLSLIWRGPYLISEWGFNGPWESENTLWGAPIESPSPTKSRHLADRYYQGISGSGNKRLLGSVAFFWGQKYERTPTWFSMFTRSGEVSEMAHTLGNLWRGDTCPFTGPRVEYLLLGGRGARDSIMLTAGLDVFAAAQLSDSLPAGLQARWEIRSEDWWGQGEVGVGPEPLPGLIQSADLTTASFVTPRHPGPYRLYYHVSDTAGYYSAANLPFYVLASDDR
ncbi:hypothetical protein CGL56_01630 [Neolewinella marina]|uniref:Glycoside hydrolase family 2 catalytic domain-containing protein n=1 Tax=Neolewinella marina TaxID=438751 RepID=A0A2G0CIH8_9BACT|nr:hypothetical protein CGL56_01630 [Neolewinella marina]